MTLNSARSLRFCVLLIVLAIPCLFMGCGDGGRPVHVVRGTVKFKKDGSVARFGTIEFRSEAKPIVTARSTIQKDGSFSMRTGDREGAVAGWHTVVIMQAVQNLHGRVKHDHGLEAAKKYVDHRTTDLRLEVTELSGDENLEILIDNLGN